MIDSTQVIGLAELVVSLPGGSAQRWHYDGVGATAQVACCDITAALGPTELVPRILPPDYVHGRSRAARGPYDLTTLLSRVGWVFLRPFATKLIKSRTLLPATVRTNRGPAPLRTATLETVVEPPEEPRNTYWCVRHGQSTANVENIISSNPLIGSTKHELTALGKEQAHVAGADLWANLSELEVPLEDVVVYS